MSLKAIELQVALPRTVEAGKLQEQLTQKPTVDQHQTAMMNQSEQEQNRIRSAPIIASNETMALHEQNERAKQEKWKENKEKNDKEEDKQHHAVHPYKGKHIDFSL